MTNQDLEVKKIIYKSTPLDDDSAAAIESFDVGRNHFFFRWKMVIRMIDITRVKKVWFNVYVALHLREDYYRVDKFKIVLCKAKIQLKFSIILLWTKRKYGTRFMYCYDLGILACVYGCET